MARLLDRASAEYQALRAQNGMDTERLLAEGRLDPHRDLMPRRGSGAMSLLYWAVYHEWRDGVALLMRYGASPSAPEPRAPCQGSTAMEYVHTRLRDNDNKEYLVTTSMQSLRVLLGDLPVNASIDAHDGQTALMHAARWDEAITIRYLLDDRGANPLQRDDRGHTALWHAMDRADFETLLRRGEGHAPEPLRQSIALLAETSDPRAYADNFPRAMDMVEREYNRLRALHWRNLCRHGRL